MKKYRALFLPIILIVILSSFFVFSSRHIIKRKIYQVVDNSKNYLLNPLNSCDHCETLFDDNVTVHEQAYKIEGIQPQASDAGLEELLANKTLIELSSNQFYTVRDLSFSKPYLLPKAQDFIVTLAQSYQAKCQESNLSYYPFTISSGTRSVASVQKLMKHNINSIRNSSHLKGKTFDVSYMTFSENEQQLKAFILTLDQMRNKGKCYVKFERNGTLHITVI
jgi:hypothetical protein